MARLHANTVFDIANRKYFGNRLPKIHVRWTFDLPEDHAGIYMYPGKGQPGVILLNADFKTIEVLWIATLLHEMVHLELRDRRIKDHGYIFRRRMRELVMAGAFDDLL